MIGDDDDEKTSIHGFSPRQPSIARMVFEEKGMAPRQPKPGGGTAPRQPPPAPPRPPRKD